MRDRGGRRLRRCRRFGAGGGAGHARRHRGAHRGVRRRAPSRGRSGRHPGRRAGARAALARPGRRARGGWTVPTSCAGFRASTGSPCSRSTAAPHVAPTEEAVREVVCALVAVVELVVLDLPRPGRAAVRAVRRCRRRRGAARRGGRPPGLAALSAVASRLGSHCDEVWLALRSTDRGGQLCGRHRRRPGPAAGGARPGRCVAGGRSAPWHPAGQRPHGPRCRRPPTRSCGSCSWRDGWPRDRHRPGVGADPAGALAVTRPPRGGAVRGRRPAGRPGRRRGAVAAGRAGPRAGPLEPFLADDRGDRRPGQRATGVWVDRGSGLARVPCDVGDARGVRRLAVRLAALAGRRLDDESP